MAGSFPRFRLFEDDGVTLVYEFEQVTDWSPDPFQDPKTSVIHRSLRGQGGISSPGSPRDWEFTLTFRLSGDGYEDLVSQMQSVINSIDIDTKYILKIDLTTGGSSKDLKVKRLTPIDFPITNDKSKVVTSQQGNITFAVDLWA